MLKGKQETRGTQLSSIGANQHPKECPYPASVFNNRTVSGFSIFPKSEMPISLFSSKYIYPKSLLPKPMLLPMQIKDQPQKGKISAPKICILEWPFRYNAFPPKRKKEKKILQNKFCQFQIWRTSRISIGRILEFSSLLAAFLIYICF
ncbi:hypothetical protein CDAR_43591 [Caerostris darwini]|uniref:Uncharacterized protein n=1 Tax=Caerostris darwini TaxID=1538125 RepID=A0AAV4WGM0_9ARAC|nr:hypothetical protein CDAR_43591 [Caerostris darwini]